MTLDTMIHDTQHQDMILYIRIYDTQHQNTRRYATAALQRRLKGANAAHIRQSRPEYGFGLQVKVLKTLSRCYLFARTRWRVNYFTEICSGSEAGSYLRLID